MSIVKRFIIGSFVILASMQSLAAATEPAMNKKLDSLQRIHTDLRFGMFIHFNMNTFQPGWGESRVDPKTFAPTKVDCGQWARAAKSAGMTYAILTTKHHDGFALWPSKQTAPNGKVHYTVMESAYPHDIVRMFVDSCRALGILPCFYFSMWDAASGIPGSYSDPSTLRPQWANDSTFILGQITELLDGTYGDIPLFTFDGYSWDMGHWAFPIQTVRALIKKLQPNCLIMDHNGAVPWDVDIMYYEEPLGLRAPANNTIASCQGKSISSDWFWNSSATDISKLMTVSNCVTHLNSLEPVHCNYVLNCPPNKTGVFDQAIITRLSEIGKAWKPNLSRGPMAVQAPQIERPYTPVTATATSGNAINAIDNTNDCKSCHAQSLWTASAGLPQSITLDLGAVYDTINMLLFQPQRFGGTTGNITGYTISIGTTVANLVQVSSGLSSGGTFGKWPADNSIQYAKFARKTGRYVKLTMTSVNGGSTAVVNTIVVGAHLPYGLDPDYPEAVSTLPGVPQAAAIERGAIHKVVGTTTNFSTNNDKSVSLYSLKGTLLGRKTVQNGILDLRKEFGLSSGAYVMKVQPVLGKPSLKR